MDWSLLEKIGIAAQPHALLSDYTTFRLGGPCPALLTCQTPLQLEQTISHLSRNALPFILIGGGSNLVVSDDGVDCYIIRYYTPTPLIQQDHSRLTVSGSTLLDHLAEFAAENGLEGLTCVTGIPGTVGGAVAGNAGAFGRQVSDTLESVHLIDKKGHKKEACGNDLQFSYRDSILKRTDEMVLWARFSLKPSDIVRLKQERQDILKLRREKHPDLTAHPSAGSIFRNIEPTSRAQKRQAAGWFLEQAGAKRLRCGGAVIFDKHANIIVKGNGCRAQEVYDLAQKMRESVQEKFNLDLVREVRFVGRFDGMPQDIKEIIW